MTRRRAFGRTLPVVLSFLLVALPPLAASASGEETTEQRAGEAQLPVTAVSLFTTGVGYFQHDGVVLGNAEVTLSFSVDDINDLLKSLVLQDFDGGLVEAVTYPSQDPLSRILSSFSLDISANPSLAQLLNQARGERVTVSAASVIEGSVLGIETRAVARESGSEQVAFLNLLTADGLRQVALPEVRSVRFESARLQEELDSALAVIAANRQQDRKSITIRFTGSGERRVRVSYIRAVPVWKTSYRLVLDRDGRAQIQGWAIVENTGESDWQEVSLALVSGRPISFVMDLYTPVYTTRPRVQPPVGVSVAPQTYDRAIAAAPPPPAAARSAPIAAESAALADFAAEPRTEALAGEPIDLAQGVVASATIEGGATYRIAHPVTIPRRGAALIPIVAQTIPAERVSIFDATVLSSRALQAVRLTNTTGVQLPAGPATIFDGAIYAGDSNLPELVDGEERLASFAVDLDTAVLVRSASTPEEITRLRIVSGVLESSLKQRTTTEYVFDRVGAGSGTYLIAHPRRSGWSIVGDLRPVGETAAGYRFEVEVPAGRATTAAVVEERLRSQTFSLSTIRDDQIVFYLSQQVIDRQTAQRLERIRELRSAVSQRESARRAIETQISTIYREQERIRANIEVLETTSDLYRRYLQTLERQEDELERLQRDLEAARRAEAAARQALTSYLESL